MNFSGRTVFLLASLCLLPLSLSSACDGDDGETSESSDSNATSSGETSDGAMTSAASSSSTSAGEGSCEVDPLEGQCEAYVTCMTTKCVDAYEQCYGDLLNSGTPGGVCGDWLNCAAACDCDDDACKQACEMDQACTDCNVNVLGGCAASMCLDELAACGG